MLEFGPNGSSPKLKKPSPAVKNSEVERNYFVTFLSPTGFLSNLNMSQTMEEERVKIEQIIETKAFLDNPEALPWYEPEIQTLAPDNSELFQEYSKIPPSEITQHIKKVRDDAFSVYPYPCIGNWTFLNFSIRELPTYNEALQRVKNGGRLLDLGCCFGQDIRRLVYDGAPSEHIYASDLRVDFWDYGYDMFLDKSSFKAKFIEADIFNTDSELKQLDGKIDVVSASSFFHLFLWEDQVKAAKRVVQLLKPVAGSMIIGQQGWQEEAKHFYMIKNHELWWHNLESWERMWKQVGEETGTVWKVEASIKHGEDWSQRIQTKVVPPKLGYMKFTVRRV